MKKRLVLVVILAIMSMAFIACAPAIQMGTGFVGKSIGDAHALKKNSSGLQKKSDGCTGLRTYEQKRKGCW